MRITIGLLSSRSADASRQNRNEDGSFAERTEFCNAIHLTDLVERDPAFRPIVEDGIDTLLLEWERIAADPGHAIPTTLAHARGRLERFLGEFRRVAAR